MKLRFVILGILMLTPLVWSACDSGQYGKKSKTEPKAKSETMPMAEAPSAEETSVVEGAFMAPEGAGGAAENDEGVSHYKHGTHASSSQTNLSIFLEWYQMNLGSSSTLNSPLRMTLHANY